MGSPWIPLYFPWMPLTPAHPPAGGDAGQRVPMSIPPDSPPPLVSVIVVNYNGGPFLLDTVASVLTSRVPLEVWVVDNGSLDQSIAALAARFPGEGRLRILQNGANLGFARANNIALAQARADHLLLLNPDCLLEPDTLERMLAAMAADPRVGMAGCLIRNPDGSEQAGCRRTLPTPWSGLARALRLNRLFPGGGHIETLDLVHQPLPEAPVYVEAISGAFMLVRRAALEQVGALDEGYFLHCEDLDWCQAFQDKGWRILFVPGVSILHHKGVCSQARPLFVLWHKHRGMARFYRKFLSPRYPTLLNLLMMAGVWARFLATLPLALLERARYPAGLPASPPVATTEPDSAFPLPTSRGRRVLVTGGTGFIGQHLVAELLRQGARVSVLTRDPDKARPLWPADRVELRQGDLALPASLDPACQGVEILFHLGSYAHVLEAASGCGARHQAITEQGTTALLAAARAAGVARLVFASTVKAMGEEAPDCLDEDSPPHPETPYGRAKLAAERAVLAAGGEDLHVSVVRLPMVYGPGNKGNLPRLIEAIAQGRFPPLPETHNRRSMLHVADAVQALLRAALLPQANGQVYIATDGRTYSTGELYRLILRHLGRPPPRWRVPLGLLRLGAWLGDRLARWGLRLPINGETLRKLLGSAWYSADKIRRDLGYQPRHDLERALPEILTDMGRVPAAPPEP